MTSQFYDVIIFSLRVKRLEFVLLKMERRRRRDDRGRHDDLDLGLRRGRGRRAAAAAAAAGVVIRAVVRAVRESDRDRIRRDVAVVQDLVLEGRESKRNDTLGFLKEAKFSLSLFSLLAL